MKKSLPHFIKSNSQGFTLVEIAIVLIIFGLLIAAFITPLMAQRELQGRRETQALLNESKEALIGYAVVNRHLPCPDTKAVPNGIEERKPNGTCDKDQGTLPWNTLGVEQLDAWQHFFHYRVDTTFSNSNNLELFTIDDATGSSTIQIKGENGALVSTDSRPVAVVLSHGANGFGAINTTQTSPANQLSAPSGLDEKENADGNTIYVSRAPSAQGSVNEFDDMLIWISPKVLINRMIQAERLP
ncbi:MAG: type II secretion system protein [Pseudomonadota bacterium]